MAKHMGNSTKSPWHALWFPVILATNPTAPGPAAQAAQVHVLQVPLHQAEDLLKLVGFSEKCIGGLAK